MKRVIDGTGGGDPRYIIDKARADALIPDNPGWESEAAFRHHEHAEADVDEQDPNQSIPTPMEEVQEPSMHFETLGFREPTDHSSSSG